MRPKKNTVDFFPHRTGSGKTIAILENLYGNNGYAAWFKILEVLGSTPGHFYDFRNTFGLQFLAAKIGVSATETQEILKTLSDLEAIDPELYKNGVIWSQNFVDGLAPLYSKREGGAPGKPDIPIGKTNIRPGNSPIDVVSDPETLVSGGKNTQRKGKERKGKERRVEESRDNLKVIRRRGFENFDLHKVDTSDQLEVEVLEAFIDHRVRIKKPLTPYALCLACRDALKVQSQCGMDPNEAINHVISMGWQGCNPKYFENNAPRAPAQRKQLSNRQQYMEDVGNLLEDIDGTQTGGGAKVIGQAPQSLPGGGT